MLRSATLVMIVQALVATACTAHSRSHPLASPSLPAASATCLAIVGGQPTNGYESVWALGANGRVCTGTFVSDTTLLTAAHCLPCDGSAVTLYTNQNFIDLSNPLPATVTTSRRAVAANPQACDGAAVNLGNAGRDLAAVIFDPGTATVSSLVGSSSPEVTAAVGFVGYGFRASPDGVGESPQQHYKTLGTNTLAAVPAAAQGFSGYVVTSSGAGTPGASRVAEGDSGAPLLTGSNAVIGVASSFADFTSAAGGSGGTTHGVFFASLFSPDGQAFLKQAQAAGATVHIAPASPAGTNGCTSP